jgi:hypothetical protein
VPLTLLSPASIVIGCELSFVDDRLFGPRLFRSLSREVEQLSQSETPSLDKHASSIARLTPFTISQLCHRDP